MELAFVITLRMLFQLADKLLADVRVLDRLYGPPVYVRVLKRFNLDYLRICGYGLRYGAYVWQYHWNRRLDELSQWA